MIADVRRDNGAIKTAQPPNHALEVRHHQTDILFVALVHQSFVAQSVLARGAFTLKQVVFERFATRDFLTAARCFKAFGRSFTRFEFRHV